MCYCSGVNTFQIYASYGPLEIAEDSGVIKGEAYIYTQEGNRHTVWAPKSLLEALQCGDAVLALGETPHGLVLHPIDYNLLHDMVLNGPFGVIKKKPVCECGSSKAKLPFHSSWCPVK